MTRASLLEPADVRERPGSAAVRTVVIDGGHVDCTELGFDTAGDTCLDDPDATFDIPVWLAAGRPACRGVELPAPTVLASARLDLAGGGELTETILRFDDAGTAARWVPGDLEAAAFLLTDLSTRCSAGAAAAGRPRSGPDAPASFTSCDLGDECVEIGQWMDDAGNVLVRVDNVVIRLTAAVTVGMRVRCDGGECGPVGGGAGAVSGVSPSIVMSAIDKVVGA